MRDRRLCILAVPAPAGAGAIDLNSLEVDVDGGATVQRLANAVGGRAGQGVNGGVISLDGKGETQLARPTADGVREPLNRRATIGINFR